MELEKTTQVAEVVERDEAADIKRLSEKPATEVNEETAEYWKEYGEWLTDSKAEYYSPVLEGLTVNALGDSYFAGNKLPREQIWLNIMASKYGMTMRNHGVGGATMSRYVTTNYPTCDRWNTMDDNNADIVLLASGKNDFNKRAPLGDVDSMDTTTFSGALNVIVEGLKGKYPNAMIVCISTWNFPDIADRPLTYREYADTMEAVAKRQGIYFIRACDPEVSGINMRDEEFRRTYSMKPTDISHLNFEGMKIVMTHYERILAEYYEDFLQKKKA